MKISKVPTGTIIQCCGSKAQVLKHGELGTRVNVLQAKEVEFSGFILGFQIWSSESDVELLTETAPSELNIGKLTIGELFGG